MARWPIDNENVYLGNQGHRFIEIVNFSVGQEYWLSQTFEASNRDDDLICRTQAGPR